MAIACAIASASRGFVCPADTMIFGEVGLSGEVRAVAQVKERLSEAEKLGFTKAIIPKRNLKNLEYKGSIKILAADNIYTAIEDVKHIN